jgi:hypothetical protein
MKRIGVGILWAVGIYFVVRALAEPFVIDVNDPATYRDDWGGPHLAGVLLVHCGLGVIAAALMAWRLMQRLSKRLRRLSKPTAADERRSGTTQRADQRRPDITHNADQRSPDITHNADQRRPDVTRKSADRRGSDDDDYQALRTEAGAHAA